MRPLPRPGEVQIPAILAMFPIYLGRCRIRQLHAAQGRGLRTFLAAAAAAVLFAAPARPGSGLVVGFGDAWLLQNPAAAVTAAELLGATAFRVPLYWQRGQTQLFPDQIAAWDPAVATSLGMRIVVVATGTSARGSPQTGSARNAFCGFVRSFLERYPTIDDVVIWNEPNKTSDWQPQFSRGKSVAPAAYEALLERCYDVLHGLRKDVNVLAPATSPNGNDDPRALSNVSHSPGNFIRRLGKAYRASGRTLPIFDNVAQHMYGATPAERPWRQHPTSGMIAEGDWAKLVTAFKTAFAGTAQPVPGRCVAGRCASIWYMEAGYQTTIDPSKRRLYRFRENVPNTVPPNAGGESSAHPDAGSRAPDQATQLGDGLRLAYCQPYVAAFFNYLLRDDADLRGWQSGVLWRDGTPKGSFRSFQSAVTDVREGTVDCSALKGGSLPQPS